MFKNYLKIASRNINRNKIYSMINIFGLSVGMACCIVICLFVQDEMSYNMFHEKVKNIYRVESEIQLPTRLWRSTHTRSNFAKKVEDYFPEVLYGVRTLKLQDKMFSINGNRFKDDFFFAEQNLFNIFSFPVIEGDLNSALSGPDKALITESFKKKHFPDEDPIGKTIIYDNKFNFSVVGIISDIPKNSDIRFNILVSFESLREIWGSQIYDRESFSHTTYLLLKDGISPGVLENMVNGPVGTELGILSSRLKTKYFIKPLSSIHFASHLDYLKFSDVRYSYVLSAAAFIILLIACINFVNLSTARASKRSKEVGIRKVVGANRFQLFKQFLGESILLSFIALIFGLILAGIFLPSFNSVAGKELNLNFGSNIQLLGILIVITFLVGILSGSYPAVLLSSFHPDSVFRGDFKISSLFGILLRKGLVVLQFSLSLIFIIGTLIVYYQLSFLKNKDLGFEKDNIITVSLIEDVRIGERYETIRNELLAYPDIRDMAASGIIPGTYGGYPEKFVPEGFSKDEPVQLALFKVSDNYFDFYNIQTIAGETFSSPSVDKNNSVILNEKAVKAIGWETPIGKKIHFDSEQTRYNEKGNAVSSSTVDKWYTVIGVVKDYHAGSLHEEIKPMIFRYRPDMYNYFSFKINPDNVSGTISFLENKWKNYASHVYFDYFFNDDLILKQYSNEDKIWNIFKYSSIIAIILASLGLFGLVSFSANQRIREIGIRKVFGASVRSIFILMTKGFVGLIIISNFIAWPVVYYLVSYWFRNFAYKSEIGAGIFFLGSLLTLVITVMTVSFQAIKAALTDPVKVLRYE
ncbi:ABC transporter permease [candidate division KSB1 bacterium]